MRPRCRSHITRSAAITLSGHPLVAQVLSRFRPPPLGTGGVLLDVGCAEGTLTRGLAQLPGVSQVIGLDVQPELIREARAGAAAGRAAALDFREGSATDTRLFQELAGTLHYVTCFTTLHWLKDSPYAQELAITNFARALRPGGQLFLVHFLGLDDSFLELEAETARTVAGERYVPERWAYTPRFAGLEPSLRLAQFQGLFRATCLRVEEARVASDTFPVATDQFQHFLRGASTIVGALPEAKQGAFLAHWQDRMVAEGKVLQEGENLEMKTVALLAVLRKEGSPPEHFYDRLVSLCRDGVLRLEELGGYMAASSRG